MTTSTQTTIPASPTKLRTGAWGARTSGPAKEGDIVTITTSTGKSWRAVVEKVVWGNDETCIVATRSIDQRPVAPVRPAGPAKRCWECGRTFGYSECKRNHGDWSNSYCGC